MASQLLLGKQSKTLLSGFQGFARARPCLPFLFCFLPLPSLVPALALDLSQTCPALQLTITLKSLHILFSLSGIFLFLLFPFTSLKSLISSSKHHSVWWAFLSPLLKSAGNLDIPYHNTVTGVSIIFVHLSVFPARL